MGMTKPSGLQPADATPAERNCLRLTKIHNFGRWNIHSLNTGKLYIVKDEMERLSIDILGLDPAGLCSHHGRRRRRCRKFYGDLQQAIDQVPTKDTIFIAGDFNAKV
ncbi:hypothetical protein P4O66_018090, partial [Electrophorus voltai]